MQKRFPGLLIVAFLTACGGGGGSGSPAPGPGGSPPGPTIASVSGKVVDDTSGGALPGVSVGLAPWIADATPMPEGTTAPDGTFAFNAQPGHYLLVIGSNSPADTTRATIHDNVTLVAGTNALQAPVLPPWPTVTPPAWELNGTYRLQTIDAATELPCFNAYNAQRTSHNLPQVVFDEWLKENTRDFVTWHSSPQYGTLSQPPSSHALTSDDAFGGSGISTTCDVVVLPLFASASSTAQLSPHNNSFGGSYSSGFGLIEYPLDPRFQADSSGFPWP